MSYTFSSKPTATIKAKLTTGDYEGTLDEDYFVTNDTINIAGTNATLTSCDDIAEEANKILHIVGKNIVPQGMKRDRSEEAVEQ